MMERADREIHEAYLFVNKYDSDGKQRPMYWKVYRDISVNILPLLRDIIGDETFGTAPTTSTAISTSLTSRLRRRRRLASATKAPTRALYSTPAPLVTNKQEMFQIVVRVELRIQKQKNNIDALLA